MPFIDNRGSLRISVSLRRPLQVSTRDTPWNVEAENGTQPSPILTTSDLEGR